MIKENYQLDWKILRKAIYGNLTSGESEIFNRWLEQNQENREFYEKAIRFRSDYDSSDSIPEYSHEQAWKEFARFTRKGRKVYLRRWTAIAASLAVIAVSGYLVVSQAYRNRSYIPQDSPVQVIEPGRSVARLTLDNGKVITLEKQDTLISIDETKTIIRIDSGKVNYVGSVSAATGDVRLNKIEIPHGGEFQIILADRTKIWINSESSIEYPVNFATDRRVVRLSGEAFFEVSQDIQRPFIIETNNLDITVLGTSFNISAYPDDNSIRVTLVTGKIELDAISGLETTTLTLNPRQQFHFEKNINQYIVKTVDPAIHYAWIHGSFVFEEEPLSDIFRKLGRWYDIQVSFLETDLRNELFSGKLPRFEDFQVILDLINKVSKAEFELNGSTVILK